MEKIEKIFVVINPNSEEQPALTRGAEIAERLGAELHAHLCVYAEGKNGPDQVKQEEMASRTSWLVKILDPIKQKDIRLESEVAWDKNWQDELGRAVKQIKPDLIVKSLKRNPDKSRKLKLLPADWTLFDKAVCPVLLVNPATKSTGKILAAIDINRSDDKYQEIMDLVIARAHNIAESRKAELHVVNAYNDTADYVHITDVAKKAKVSNEFVHVIGGEPENIILNVAAKIGAELVILGISAKHKITTRLFGYTSEWLLNNLSQDVMVIVPPKSD